MAVPGSTVKLHLAEEIFMALHCCCNCSSRALINVCQHFSVATYSTHLLADVYHVNENDLNTALKPHSPLDRFIRLGLPWHILTYKKDYVINPHSLTEIIDTFETSI